LGLALERIDGTRVEAEHLLSRMVQLLAEARIARRKYAAKGHAEGHAAMAFVIASQKRVIRTHCKLHQLGEPVDVHDEAGD
jgi:hypothetical protein